MYIHIRMYYAHVYYGSLSICKRVIDTYDHNCRIYSVVGDYTRNVIFVKNDITILIYYIYNRIIVCIEMCLVGFQIKGSIMKATSLIDFCSIASCRSKEFIFDEQEN